MRVTLASKKVCCQMNLIPELFYEILGEIEAKFNQAKVIFLFKKLDY